MNTSKHIYLHLLILSISLVFFSCKKENGSKPNQGGGETIGLSFNTLISDDFTDLNKELKASTNLSNYSIREEYGTFIGSTKNQDFEVATFVKNTKSSSSNGNKSIKAQSEKNTNSNNLKATIPLGTGMKYRVYLRNRATGEWQTKVFSSNSTSGADTISIYKHNDYDWYAFSQNTNANTDVPDIRSGNTLKIKSENKDLLWAKGEVLASNDTGNKKLNIVFQHKLAQLKVYLDYRGIFVNTLTNYAFNFVINNPSGNATSLQRGDLDILTGNFIAGTHANYTPSITATFNEPPYVDQQTYYLYSSTASNYSNIILTFPTLAYSTYDGRNVSLSNRPLTLQGTGTNGIVTEIGGSTTLNFLFIESPVKSGNANTEWARANLYYEGDAAHNPYRFRRQTTQAGNPPNNSFIYRSAKVPNKDMFMKNHKKPDTYANRPLGDRNNTAIYPLGDPCLEVFPKGAWKKPSHQDFVDFVASVPKYPWGDFNTDYFKGITHLVGGPNSQNTLGQYESNYVVFERNGFINNTDLVVTTNFGYYWSDRNPGNGGTQIGSLLKIEGDGESPFTNQPWFVSVVNQVAQTAASIRCVRTTLYQ